VTHAAAVRDVASQWGGRQVLTGPIVSIPEEPTHTDGKGRRGGGGYCTHLLPERMHVEARLSPEVRRKGIYRVPLYAAVLTIRADFLLSSLRRNREEPLWSDSYLSIGLSDVKGITALRKAVVNGIPVIPEPGVRNGDHVSSGFTIPLPALSSDSRVHVEMEIDVRGSQEFCIAPVGRNTTAVFSSSWADPGFIGDYLPVKRDVSAAGFRAEWSVLDFNRNLPQSWTGAQKSLSASTFGARFVMPVDEYQKNERAVKYAILFIALTFLGFFLIDTLGASPFHPVHYLLAGLGLILFFVLLLSLSEYVAFNTAYAGASAAILLLVSLYTKGVTGKWAIAASIGGILLGMYAFLFVLLQLEDLALLLGSIGLLCILAAVMHLTRRIDWFHSSSAGGQ
jgi:inner membrane protein